MNVTGRDKVNEEGAVTWVNMPRCVIDHDHGADEGHCVYETDTEYSARLASHEKYPDDIGHDFELATPDNAGRSSIQKEAASADAGGSPVDVDVLERAMREHILGPDGWPHMRGGLMPANEPRAIDGCDDLCATAIAREYDRLLPESAGSASSPLSESTGSEGPR